MVRAVPTFVGALVCALSLLLSPIFASPVLAHGKSLSYSAWHLDEDGAQVLTTADAESTAGPEPTAAP